jgi:hypothetical protein
MDPDPDPDLPHYKDKRHNCGQYPGGGKGERGIYLLYYGINIAIVDISPSTPLPPPTTGE